MGDELRADPNAITKYAGEIFKNQGAVFGPVATLRDMTPLANQGLGGWSDAGQFAEARVVMAALARNTAVFGDFLGDLGNGITAIANAAQVCADAYRDTDAENAESIDTINYAFGDPGAARPAGLDKRFVTGETIVDLLAKQGPTMATATVVDAMSPDGGQTVVSFPGYTLTVFEDGSSRSVNTSYAAGGAVRVETKVTGPDGTVMDDTVETTQQYPYDAGNITVRTVETISGNTSTGTVITTGPDGTRIVQPIKNGKPNGDAEVIKPEQAPEEGPVQQALEMYGPGWRFDQVKDWGDAKPVFGLSYWGGAGPPESYGPRGQQGAPG
jgi:hypothetical protein